jgi:hypothetical protein
MRKMANSLALSVFFPGSHKISNHLFHRVVYQVLWYFPNAGTQETGRHHVFVVDPRDLDEKEYDFLSNTCLESSGNSKALQTLVKES